MTRKEALAELIEKVGKGKAPKYTPDYELALYPIKGMWAAYKAMDAYEGSLDAAKALNDAVLPESSAVIQMNGVAQLHGPIHGFVWTAFNEIPARAWLIAILMELHAHDKS